MNEYQIFLKQPNDINEIEKTLFKHYNIILDSNRNIENITIYIMCNENTKNQIEQKYDWILIILPLIF